MMRIGASALVGPKLFLADLLSIYVTGIGITWADALARALLLVYAVLFPSSTPTSSPAACCSAQEQNRRSARRVGGSLGSFINVMVQGRGYLSYSVTRVVGCLPQCGPALHRYKYVQADVNFTSPQMDLACGGATVPNSLHVTAAQHTLMDTTRSPAASTLKWCCAGPGSAGTSSL